MVEHQDVVIVGAGLSGIGAACRLKQHQPKRSFIVLEARQRLGGTWDLFRYPGVRSDSDMFTLAYPFNPWTQPRSIVGGETIWEYIRSTARRHGVEEHIRFGHRLEAARWDSRTCRWTLSVRTEGAQVELTCRFLYLCSGYYSYDGGYAPRLAGLDDFQGSVIHPQNWPPGLDLEGKKVVVVGSGATAVTLVPALANTASSVTMLQRSPTYMAVLPSTDPLAAAAAKRLPAAISSRLSRWRSVVAGAGFYQFCRRWPNAARRLLRSGVARQLPADYPIEPDFAPRYNPWDQRLCVVPDGDLFKAISSGRAKVVTGVIERFEPGGVRLQGGALLEADVVVLATGLVLLSCGGVRFEVDGKAVHPADCFLYRGFMLSDLPNLAMCIGYTNASWTLRADLSSRYVCRLLALMAQGGYTKVVPRYRGDPNEALPFLPLTSGYVQRALSSLPKQGRRSPWRLRQNYLVDFLEFKLADLLAGLELCAPAPDLATRTAKPARALSLSK